MKMAEILDLWDWKYICPTGITPTTPDEPFVASCYLQICWQLPLLMAFTIASAYHFGNQTVLVRRSPIQQCSITLRVLIALLLISLSCYKTLHMIVNGIVIWPIDIMLCAFQVVAWFIHIG